MAVDTTMAAITAVAITIIMDTDTDTDIIIITDTATITDAVTEHSQDVTGITAIKVSITDTEATDLVTITGITDTTSMTKDITTETTDPIIIDRITSGRTITGTGHPIEAIITERPDRQQDTM